MKIYYVTLQNQDQAKNISHDLLTNHLAACTNWFPIHSMYRWENKIQTDAEIVLIIKTKENLRPQIETVIKTHIDYTNFIAELDVQSVNADYLTWLNQEIKY